MEDDVYIPSFEFTRKSLSHIASPSGGESEYVIS